MNQKKRASSRELAQNLTDMNLCTEQWHEEHLTQLSRSLDLIDKIQERTQSQEFP